MLWKKILNQIVNECDNRGLSLSLLAKQTRIRLENIHRLQTLAKSTEYITLSPGDKRLILKLSSYLNLNYNLNELNENSPNPKFKFKQNTLKFKPVFVWFTANNLNLVLGAVISLTVVVLVGLPAYLVLRPAELVWQTAVTNQSLNLAEARQEFKGVTYRAKGMTFGGQNIILKDGLFVLDLPKPKEPTPVLVVLTNYFNLKTEYIVVVS